MKRNKIFMLDRKD